MTSLRAKIAALGLQPPALGPSQAPAAGAPAAPPPAPGPSAQQHPAPSQQPGTSQQAPAASQQPAYADFGYSCPSLMQQWRFQQSQSQREAPVPALPPTQPLTQQHNADDYIWIGTRRIKKESAASGGGQRAALPPSLQLGGGGYNGADLGAARQVVAVPDDRDLFDDDFIFPAPRPVQRHGRKGKAAAPAAAAAAAAAAVPAAAAAAAPMEGSDSDEDVFGLRPAKAACPPSPGGTDDDEEAGLSQPSPSQPRRRQPAAGQRSRKQAAAPKLALLDELLMQQAEDAAAEASTQPMEDDEGEQAPVARAAVRPAAATTVERGRPLKPREQQQQPAVVAPAERPNAPTGGPNEDLPLVADDTGAPLPPGSTEEPWLDLAVPAAINRYLRDYQRDGIRFLFRQYARGTGGVLADDMGLGKTIQAIGFIAAVLGKTGDPSDAHLPPLERLERLEAPLEDSSKLLEDDWVQDYTRGYPVMVVAPTSVLSNWEREFANWGHFRTVVVAGKTRESAVADILEGRREVMIVSIDTMKTMQDIILTVPWHMVIFDEAHILKNSKSQRYKTANRLPTRLRFGLTGTPFQNDYEEIYNVVDLLAPDSLGSKKDFMKDFANAIMRGQKSNASQDQLAAGAEAQDWLRKSLSAIILRRTKKLIAHQLPQKLDHVVFCELTPLQLKAYRNVLKSPDLELVFRYEERPCPGCQGPDKYFKCCGWRCTHEQGGVLWPMYHDCDCDDVYDEYTNPKGCKCHKPEGCWVQGKFGYHRVCPFCLILPTCSILRKISNHLELVKAAYQDEETAPTKFYKALEIAKLAIGEDEDEVRGYVTTENYLHRQDTSACGKMQALTALLDTWDREGGNKVLLFSNSTKLLHILHSLMDSKGYTYLYLDGSVPQQDRQKMVDEFNNSPSTFVFLISTLAGGTGLNLTAANKVLIFDPSWNPAMDLQAQDRAFRIGQTRDVSVYRFIARGTLEDMIYNRQIYKEQHSKMVLEGAAQPRMFEGAKIKNSKDDQGELWGLHNLLRMNKDSILSIDLLEAQRRRERGEVTFRVELHNMHHVYEVERGTGGGEAARNGGNEEDDLGLQAMVEQEIAPLLEEGEEGPAPAPGRPAAAPGPAPGQILAEEAAEQQTFAAARKEQDLLREMGITGMLDHSMAFKHAGEDAAAKEAVQAVDARRKEAAAAAAAAAASNAPKRARTQPQAYVAPSKASGLVQAQEAPLLESLVELMGVPLQDAARQLLSMTQQERAALRRQFAEEDDPSLRDGGSKDGGGGGKTKSASYTIM